MHTNHPHPVAVSNDQSRGIAALSIVSTLAIAAMLAAGCALDRADTASPAIAYEEATSIALQEAALIWDGQPRAQFTERVDTVEGVPAWLVVIRTTGPEDDEGATEFLNTRDDLIAAIPATPGESPEEELSLRALEERALGEGWFGTIAVGDDGQVLANQAGVPLGLASPAALENLSAALGAARCGPVLVAGEGVGLTCDSGAPMSGALSGHIVPPALPEPTEEDGAEAYPSDVPVPAVSARFPVGGSNWYHYPGSSYHYPSSGFYSADDTYALDLNKTTGSSADCGEAVYAVASGTVKQVSSGSGWVLIQHSGTVSWLGQSYSSWWSGYGHMRNLTVSSGATVSAGQKIGEVYNTGTSSCHLHFALYVGSYRSSTNNRMLMSVDPDTFGSAYASFDYNGTGRIYDTYVDDQRSSGSYTFTRGGSSDWYSNSSYGMLGGMRYTHAATGSNTATWLWSDGTPKTASYRIYAFIPRNYGTSTRTVYQLYGGSSGTSSLGSTTVNQSSLYDYWTNLGTKSLTAGHKFKVYVSDATGESTSKYIAFDIIRRWYKSDSAMYQ
jgi:murein DD-endopeptidase MepM/ murein hydrolase activator NlpD